MPTKVIKTLDDIINKNDRYDFNKIIFYDITDDGRLVIHQDDLFRTYMRFINYYVAQYKISYSQRQYYQYKPDLLSQDIYGTPELSWMILMLNDQESPSKFRLKATVRLIDPEVLATLYDTVLTRSTDKLKQNWNEYLPMVSIEDDSE